MNNQRDLTRRSTKHQHYKVLRIIMSWSTFVYFSEILLTIPINLEFWNSLNLLSIQLILSFCIPLGKAGLKNLDYLIKVNGQEVFEKKHAEIVKIIKESPDTLELEIERSVNFFKKIAIYSLKNSKNLYFWFWRGDEGVDVVPNFDWICPREKVEEEVSS